MLTRSAPFHCGVVGHLLRNSGGSRNLSTSSLAKANNAGYSPKCANPFTEIGFPEPFEFQAMDYTVRDLKNMVASLTEDSQDSSFQHKFTAVPDEHGLDLPRTSYLNSYRMTKSSDYAWALREHLLPSISQDGDAIKRLNYLESSMHAVNDHQRPIISLDLKIVGGAFREVGFAIYDPRFNVNCLIPEIKRIHVISQEHFGVLSTNTFHGQSFLLAQKEMIKFTRAVMNRYFSNSSPSEKPVIAGFNISQPLNTLQKAVTPCPTDLNSLLDLYYLYITPSLFRRDILTSGFMNTTTLELILDRLSIPYSELSNPGNKSYFILVALLKLLNPYERHRLKLDSPKETIKFQETRMVANLTNVMRRGRDGFTGFNRPLTTVTQAKDYKDALKKLYH